MKVLPWVLGVAGIALLASAIGLGIWAGMPANPLATLWILISQGSALSKLVYLLMVGLAIWLGLASRSASVATSIFTVLVFLPLGLGLAATLLAGLSVRMAMVETHTTDLMVIAPSLADALTPLAVGLLLAAAAAAARRKSSPSGGAAISPPDPAP
jgi:hypothetical protein